MAVSPAPRRKLLLIARIAPLAPPADSRRPTVAVLIVLAMMPIAWMNKGNIIARVPNAA